MGIERRLNGFAEDTVMLEREAQRALFPNLTILRPHPDQRAFAECLAARVQMVLGGQDHVDLPPVEHPFQAGRIR